MFFTWVWNPPLFLVPSHLSFALISTLVSPPPDNPENQFAPIPPPGVPSCQPSLAVCGRPHLSSHHPSSPPCFPITPLAPWRPKLSADMSQRHPRGWYLGSAPPNLRPERDAGLLSSFCPLLFPREFLTQHRGVNMPGRLLPMLSPHFSGQWSLRSLSGRTCSPAWPSWSAGDRCG